MIHTIRLYIEKYRLLSEDRPVLVGLSGGADSVALLGVLVRLGYPCIALHCNFHLRGEESDHGWWIPLARIVNYKLKKVWIFHYQKKRYCFSR